jgi:hypothetical protein
MRSRDRPFKAYRLPDSVMHQEEFDQIAITATQRLPS